MLARPLCILVVIESTWAIALMVLEAFGFGFAGASFALALAPRCLVLFLCFHCVFHVFHYTILIVKSQPLTPLNLKIFLIETRSQLTGSAVCVLWSGVVGVGQNDAACFTQTAIVCQAQSEIFSKKNTPPRCHHSP